MKCKECNKEIENFETKGPFYGVCDKCYLEEEKSCSEGYSDRKIPILDTSRICFYDELIKLREEQNELFEALNTYPHTIDQKEHVIEEFFDNVQAALNCLDKVGILDMLEEGRKTHIKKMLDRGWKIKRMI